MTSRARTLFRLASLVFAGVEVVVRALGDVEERTIAGVKVDHDLFAHTLRFSPRHIARRYVYTVLAGYGNRV